ncbi:MAG: superoxide dismutase [Candidatus Pacebacteria bacterium]|nr:superoxide dismutase [Candidatus Paceibacterota bacterium]
MEYQTKTFELPKVIPGISKEQIDLHLGLYGGYVKHVNLLYAQLNKLSSTGAEGEFTYAIQELRRRLGFEWSGMRLHELYFDTLVGGPQVLMADSPLYTALIKQYGAFSKWLDIFQNITTRGPGWALLHYDPVQQQFLNTWVADHEVGQLAGVPILLAVDHWEHAYMVDYTPANKSTYINAYFTALNWHTVSSRFDSIAWQRPS